MNGKGDKSRPLSVSLNEFEDNWNNIKWRKDMWTIRKKFKFEMAHQLSTAYSECCSKQIHGHSYLLELYFKSDKLDKTGMVIDFGEIKAKLEDYVKSWDHSLVMPNDFPMEYLAMLRMYNENIKIVNYNPTAEKMSEDMYDYIKKIIPQLCKVTLWETATGEASYEE